MKELQVMGEGMNLKGRDAISINDFSREEVDYILDKAGEIEGNPGMYRKNMWGKIMFSCFFEPSTRTRTSFQTAMMVMGGNVINIDESGSSRKKGETLKHTAKMIQGYTRQIPYDSVVVVRQKKDGSANVFAKEIDSPVLNGGDGRNQHPTQTFLDLYTIREINGEIDGVTIGIAGDLKYGRTVHSLAEELLDYENVKMVFVSPEELSMPEKIVREAINKAEVDVRELEDLEKTLSEIDMLYMTRVQRERFPEGPEGEEQYRRVSRKYHLNREMLRNARLKPNFRIMHPLPTVGEIDSEIDDSVYQHYFKQAENGLYVRKALLELVIGGENG